MRGSVTGDINALTERGRQALRMRKNVLTTAKALPPALRGSHERAVRPRSLGSLRAGRQQVVGISSEITYTNFFGMSSAALSGAPAHPDPPTVTC